MNQYLGEIRIFLQDNIPDGFLVCDGREVFINEYPRLYMVIGCQFGGDELTRFNLPKIACIDNSKIEYCIASEGEKKSF